MREHMGLYRGKRKDNGEWIEGRLIAPNFILPCGQTLHIDTLLNELFVLPSTPVFAYSVDPDTVGECTGQRDKNGKLIFEGDAYRYFDDEIQVAEWDEDTHNIGLHTYGEREVKQGRKTIKEKYEGWNALWDYPLEEMDYLGNIHDNPELLKGGEGDGNEA